MLLVFYLSFCNDFLQIDHNNFKASHNLTYKLFFAFLVFSNGFNSHRWGNPIKPHNIFNFHLWRRIPRFVHIWWKSLYLSSTANIAFFVLYKPISVHLSDSKFLQLWNASNIAFFAFYKVISIHFWQQILMYKILEILCILK